MKIPSLAVKVIICIAICLGLGLLSGLSTKESLSTWYSTLEKPSFNPPNWLFGPAWTLLYTLMGVALALVWHKGLESKVAKTAVVLFSIQLALNLLWSLLFFGLQNPMVALVDIIILWGLILATIIQFAKIDKAAAGLLVPYLLWVSFATALNFCIWMLN